MSQKTGRFAALFLSFVLISACNSASTQLESTPTILPTLELFTTQDPAAGSTQVTELPSNTLAPAATPTPLTYLIVEGDTLLGIAERNGISLDDLLVANPDVDARFLVIGQEILIPVGSSSSGSDAIASSDIAPLSEGPVHCLANAANELWCFFPVSNNTDAAVENAVAEISLYNASGEIVDTKVASGFIQKMDIGAAMPLIAYWPIAPSGWQSAEAQLLSAFRLDDPSNRYLEATALLESSSISDSGLIASLEGQLSIESGNAPSSLRLLALAFDESGSVVGFRRLDANQTLQDFSLEVYSLGPAIVDFELLLEARR